MKARIILTAILFLAAVTAKAENGWSVENTTGSTFRITRSTSGTTETVKYRTVNLSAYAGQHYTAKSGEVTFGVNDTYKDVTISEDTQTTGAYLYQTSAKRKYRFEVTDLGGFYLHHCDREITTGTSINSNNVYAERSVTVNSGTITVTDGGFKQAYHAVPISDYYTSDSPKAYLLLAGAELRMKVELEEAEKEDGYQHIQLLVNKTTTYDDSASGANPGTPTNSHYLASFAHKPGSTLTTFGKVCFPLTSAGDNCSEIDPAWNFSPYNNSDGKLYTQKFKSGYRADDGKLIIAKKDELNGLNYVGIRYDASGDNSDTWYARNTIAKIQAADVTNPTALAYSVAPGKHAKGNTVYVTVAFSEIVTTSSAKLASNWGDLSYVAGSGSNVLTFSRTIPANASSSLNITGCSGIADLAGKAPSSVNANEICSLDASYAYTITYDLDEGTASNPTTYTWETAAITLNNPTRLGYWFDGWTGSNGSTPQTSVTIANHSHGNKSYTANWTKVWTGSGSQGDPYTITTTKGLDLLAQYVNSGNNCSSLFFQLGGPIEYSYTNAWNVASEENNYTAIGTNDHPFQGTFDGNNNTISGIRIYKGGNGWIDRYQGLFGAVRSGGKVKRVNLADARITGFHDVGGIAGGVNTGATIEDCTVAADVCIHAVQGSTYYHGGIVGSNQQGPISRCISRARLTVADASYCKDYGGIAGSNTNNIIDCIADGVVIPDVNGRGAIVGYHYGNDNNLTRNYYCGCTVAGVTNATGVGKGNSDTTTETTDVTGAKPLFAVTLPANASLVREPSATLPGSGNKTYTNGADIAGAPYAVASSNLLLSYNSASIPSGYVLSISAKETSSGTAVAVTEGGNYTYNLTMPAADVTVTATLLPIVSYIDANGNEQSHVCMPIVSETNSYGNSANAEGWYCVNSDVTIGGTQGVKFLDQQVNIVLCDGATLTCNANTINDNGIEVKNGTLAIYAQSGGTGRIVAAAQNKGAIWAKLGIDFNGGIISATTTGSTGIHTEDNFLHKDYGPVTVRRGSVTVQGTILGISAGSNITILGGTVSATATRTDAGSALYAAYGNVSILGGNVTANGFIGINASDDGSTITLGCATAADRIYASSYSGTVVIATGQTLTDGNSAHSYSGTLNSEQIAAIAGKTLMKPLGPVSYIDENGTEQTCTEYTILSDGTIPIDGNDRGNIGTSNQDTWYVATGNYSFSNHFALKANGHVHLILCDGATFIVSCSNNGIYASSLTIYGQSEGTGSLVASTTAANNAQGAIAFSGALTINGGNVSTSSMSGVGIRDNGTATLTINGGNVNAIGATYGIDSNNGTITLGWTRATDRIYASSYGSSGTIRIKDGQAFCNGTEVLSGTITDMSKLDGKTLVPATNAIAYIDADGSTKYCTEYTVIDGSKTAFNTGGWYVVSGNVPIAGLYFGGDTNIILCDDSYLNCTGNGVTTNNKNLCIYAQSGGTGRLSSSVSYAIDAAIDAIDFTLYGGIVEATNSFNGGIGVRGVSVTINGGSLVSSGDSYGIKAAGGNVVINGGNVSGSANASSGFGIYSWGGSITLGWIKPTDRITANSYYCNGTISVKSGQAFSNGTEDLSGTITDMSKLDGKTLRPSPVGGDWSATLTAHNARLYGEEYYWTTFYHATWNYRLPEGAQAFIMKSDKVLYRIGDGTIVPAGCAVVIMADAPSLTLTATMDAPVGVSADILEANILRGVSTATATSTLASYPKYVYVFGGDSTSFKSLRFSGSTVPAGKAFYVK